MKDYDEMRHDLIKMLKELDENLGGINPEKSHPQPKESVFDAEDKVRQEIDKVKLSMESMDSDSYSQCLLCGKPIPQKILAANPFAGLCGKCSPSDDDPVV